MSRHEPPDDVDPVLAQALKRLYVRPVDDARARRDVAAIAQAARAADDSRAPGITAAPRRSGRSGRRAPVWRPALAAAAAVLALPAGLAAAGVHVPGPLGAPYEAVGIELPNQRVERRVARPRPTAPASTTAGATATAPPATAAPPAPAPAPVEPRATAEPSPERPEKRRGERGERADRGDRGQGRDRHTPRPGTPPASVPHPRETDRDDGTREHRGGSGDDRGRAPGVDRSADRRRDRSDKPQRDRSTQSRSNQDRPAPPSAGNGRQADSGPGPGRGKDRGEAGDH